MIMVVTFHPEFRDKIFSFLSAKGYEVCLPPHRQDVFPLVKEKNPLVIILDMYVAEPSGLEVLRELRAQNYKGKVVALAGTSVSSLMAEAFKLGVDQVIGGIQGSGGALNLDQVALAIRTVLHSDIAMRAFELYETRGRTKGNDLGDWFEAERQILKRSIPLPPSGQTKTKAGSETVSKKPAKIKNPPPPKG